MVDVELGTAMQYSRCSVKAPVVPPWAHTLFLQHTMLVAVAHCQVVSCNQVSPHAPMVDVEVETAIQYNRCPIRATIVPPWAHTFVLQHTMLVAVAHCQVVSCNQESPHAPMVDVEVETTIHYSRCPVRATVVLPWAHTLFLQHTMLVAVAHCQVVSCNQVSPHAPMVDVEVETTIQYSRCPIRATIVPPWAHTFVLQHTMLVAVAHCQVVSCNQVSTHAPMVDVELEHQGYQPVTSSTSM
jgi:hypothetical protein